MIMMEIKHIIDNIFCDETAKLLESSKMKNTFDNINICAIVKNKDSICAIVKNKDSIKNHVMKTKILKKNQNKYGLHTTLVFTNKVLFLLYQ